MGVRVSLHTRREEAPSRLKVTPYARTLARTFGTKPIDFGTFLRTTSHPIGHAEQQIQNVGFLAYNNPNDQSHCSHNVSMAGAKLS